MKPLVVLLHGLARGQGSMAGLAKHLRHHGFDTWATSYPSRQHSIAYLAGVLADQIVAAAGERPVHAVTHSMGGIIVRHLRDRRIRWGRIVMLAPPNRGSRLAAGLVRNPLFQFFYGPAGLELADASAWPAPPVPPAVIAGTRSYALTNVTSWTAGRRFPVGVKNDGTVAVEETKLDAMAAFEEVDATHTWIMNSPHVRHLVVTYLSEGCFPGVTP